jgi:hypothetical protein
MERRRTRLEENNRQVRKQVCQVSITHLPHLLSTTSDLPILILITAFQGWGVVHLYFTDLATRPERH